MTEGVRKLNQLLGGITIIQAVEMKRCGIYDLRYIAMVPKCVCTLESPREGELLEFPKLRLYPDQFYHNRDRTQVSIVDAPQEIPIRR